MKYLVDTHLFLWIVISPKKISSKAKDLLLNPDNTKIVSIVTFWEISLKFSLGKIDLKGLLPDTLPTIAKNTGFEILNLDSDTVSTFHKLPRVDHKDPFDRMLAWQAISKDYPLLTKDADFTGYYKYGLKTVW